MIKFPVYPCVKMVKFCKLANRSISVMWTEFEEKKIKELYSELPEEKLEDWLPAYLIDSIKMEEGKAYFNLRNFTKNIRCIIYLYINTNFYTMCKIIQCVKYEEIIVLFRKQKLIEKL